MSEKPTRPHQWRVVKVEQTWSPPGTPTGKTKDAVQRGDVFRKTRHLYGLSMLDVALAWRLRVTEVSDMERGYVMIESLGDFAHLLTELWFIRAGACARGT